VKDDPRSGQPKTQRADANVDTVRTLVHSDRGVGVRGIADELNMNRGTVRDCKGNFGNEKNFRKNDSPPRQCSCV
jgi:hypothetical protein